MKIKILLTLLSVFVIINSSKSQITLQNINTETFTETTPYICFDGSKLVFLSNKSGAFEIYQCTKKDKQTWSDPELITFEGGSLGIGIQIQDPALNAMGDILYFSAQLENSKGGKDIYYSILKDNKWQKPENIEQVNSFIDETSPMISADNNYLFFAKKFNGEKKDEFIYKIYYSKYNNNKNIWIESVPVSDKINSSDENYPFFSADNRVLYFSSKKDNELDGYNLYMTKMIAENVWTEPEPLSGMNTDFDDIRPSKAANSNQLYYSQYLKKRKETLGKIYVGNLPKNMQPRNVFEFNGNITDAAGNKPIDAAIVVRYSDNMENIGKQYTKMPEGSYHFYYPQGRKLEFEVYSKNYSHSFFEYDAGYNTKIPDKPITTNIQLFNESVLLLNVFDEEIFEPLKGNIKLFNNTDDDISENRISYKGNGRYELKLDLGSIYKIIVESKNYEEYSFSFDLTGIIQYDEFEKDIELKPVKVQFEINIVDIETDEVIDEVEIIITNLEKNETIIKRIRKDENGKFIVNLRDGDKYEINVNGPKGYAFYNTKVDMASSDSKKLDVKLQSLKAKTKLVLNDITFETNSAELNASSFEELDRVVKLLIDNPEIKIEIAAHTDDVGSHSYNEKLSHKRAQSVVDYLISKALDINRLIAKGYGETAPIAANDSDENRAKNRRVELKIIDVNENAENNE